MRITAACVSDIPEICDLVNTAYRGELSKKGWTTEANLLDGIRVNQQTLLQYFNNPQITMLKFADDAIIQGCVYLEKRGMKLYLGMLSVNPLIQNSGIGKKLLAASEQFAAANKLRSIIMTVISTRAELINWYLRRGYLPTGEREPFSYGNKFGIPKQPIELITLEKPLPV